MKLKFWNYSHSQCRPVGCAPNAAPSVVHTALIQAVQVAYLQVSFLPIYSWLKLIIMNYLTLPVAVLGVEDEFFNFKLKLTTFIHCRQLNGLVNELILNCFRRLTV